MNEQHWSETDPCDCGTVRGENGFYAPHAAGEHIDCELAYVVSMGVHGAMRVIEKPFPTKEAADARALRWSQSNSTGHYWAQVKHEGRLVSQFN